MQVTVSGLDDVLAKLKKLEDVMTPIKQGIYETLREAEQIVINAYASQGYGNTDFTTSIEETETGYMLIASGADIGFLEFGAGVSTTGDEFEDEVDYLVFPGSYSLLEGKGIFFAKGYWYYGGEYGGERKAITGIAPTRGMQQALDYTRDNVERKVREKIEQWTSAN